MTPRSPLFAEPCCICGSETGPTKRELVEWREPVRNDLTGKLEVWSHVPRCIDRAACRARVELPKPAGLGEPWPIDDDTPAPARPAPVAEPVEVEELSPWFRGVKP